MGGPESRINAYPEYAADFDDGSCEDDVSVMPIPNRERLHTLDRTTDAFADWKKGDHAYYEDGEVYPSAEWSDTDAFGKPNHYKDWSLDADKELERLQIQRFKNKLDKQWQDTKDMEKYSRQADTRPLHRKGSLNRAMGESLNRKVNRIVSECLKRHTR
jgi:uncharacterized protein YcgL (UPF0745 family)